MILTEKQLKEKVEEIAKKYNEVIELGNQLEKYIDKIPEEKWKEKSKFLECFNKANALSYAMSKEVLEDIMGLPIKDVNLDNINKKAENTTALEAGIAGYLFLHLAHNEGNTQFEKTFKEELEKNDLIYFSEGVPYRPNF